MTTTHQKKKGKSLRGCGVTAVCVLLCLVLTACGATGYVLCDTFGLAKGLVNGTKTVEIQVEQGATLRQIAADLKQQDVVMNQTLFLAYAKLTGKGGEVNYGNHRFTKDMGYGEVLESLAQPALAEDISVTVPSGKTLTAIAKLLEEAGVCKADAFLQSAQQDTFDSPLWAAIPKDDAIAYKMEGYIFPDTYHFYPNDDPHRVIQVMLDNLEEHFPKSLRKQADKQGYTTHQILTMASVIELEACGYYDQMPQVSAVFYNRLNQWSAGTRLLQSDPTMYYPHGDGAYNTYKIEGLPPGPMSTVTEKAIKAAVEPDKTQNATFFVTDKNGKFYFNTTLAGHEATITDLKNQGLWLTTPFFE